MEFQAESSGSSAGDTVIVVMDASRNKGRVDALTWAIKHIVQPKDTLIVLGLLSEVNKKATTSCIPIFSGIWVRLEFSGPGELSPREFEEEIERKREEIHSILHPFYRQCKKNEVRMEAELAVGFDPRKLTIERAHMYNPRWIILDSNLRNEKVYIYGHVACNVAVMKRKDAVTLMLSKAFECEPRRETNGVVFPDSEPDLDQDEIDNPCHRSTKCVAPRPTPQSSCWYPLSWRTGFPRAFTLSELREMTDGFRKENAAVANESWMLFEAIYEETPVIIKAFFGNDEKAFSLLKVLCRVRHRSIMNLIGYCCTDDSVFLICDSPCSGTLEMNLKCDESAKNLSWKARWFVALEIGAAVRYLHEECADGRIANLGINSFQIAICHGSSAWVSVAHALSGAKLSIRKMANWLNNDDLSNEHSPAKCQNLEEDKLLYTDVSDFGTVLIELISGRSASSYQEHKEECQSLVDWALPLLENGSLREVMDARLIDTSDSSMVDHMARAALLCLKKDLRHNSTISEVLAVLRGEEFAITIKA